MWRRRAVLLASIALGCSAAPEADAPEADASAVDALALPDLGPEPDLPLPDAALIPTGDAAAAVDAAVVATDLGPPIVAPRDQWTWVDVEGTRCADGSPTGFGFNPAADPTTLLLFLQGGGACWDAVSCLGPVPTSFYVTTGYDRVAFATDVLRPVMLPL